VSFLAVQGLEDAMADTLSFYPGGMIGFPVNLKRLVEDFERRMILEALGRAGGNQRRAAAALGCLPTTLNEKMRRLGLRDCDRRAEGPSSEPTTSM
jgi:DNA-binding NtrC family response regulator